MKQKVIKLTESDLARIVKRVIKESRYSTFDDEFWADEEDRIVSKDKIKDMEADFDFEDEEFEDFESFKEKYPEQKHFGTMPGSSGKEAFDLYKKHHKKPFKVRKFRER